MSKRIIVAIVTAVIIGLMITGCTLKETEVINSNSIGYVCISKPNGLIVSGEVIQYIPEYDGIWKFTLADGTTCYTHMVNCYFEKY